MKFMNFADIGETCETWNIFEGLTWININLQSFTSITPSDVGLKTRIGWLGPVDAPCWGRAWRPGQRWPSAPLRSRCRPKKSITHMVKKKLNSKKKHKTSRIGFSWQIYKLYHMPSYGLFLHLIVSKTFNKTAFPAGFLKPIAMKSDERWDSKSNSQIPMSEGLLFQFHVDWGNWAPSQICLRILPHGLMDIHQRHAGDGAYEGSRFLAVPLVQHRHRGGVRKGSGALKHWRVYIYIYWMMNGNINTHIISIYHRAIGSMNISRPVQSSLG